MEDRFSVLRSKVDAALSALQDRSDGWETLAQQVIEEIDLALGSDGEAGKTLGPLRGRLLATLKAPKEAKIAWLEVLGGRLAVGHRPKERAMRSLHRQGVTHVVTLLSESEGAGKIGEAAKDAGLGWIWFPMENGDPPGKAKTPEILRFFEEVARTLAAGGRLYVHCSAGIHRTGMMVHGFLRATAGMPEAAAREALRSLRAHTADGIGEERLDWGDRLAAFIAPGGDGAPAP